MSDPITVITELVALSPRPIVLIDGGSGSGKSTFAARLAIAIDAELVRLDDLYPGWDGLAEAGQHVRDHVLSAEGRWQRWDWGDESPAEWHRIDPDRALVVEGSGVSTADNRRLATLSIWMELDESTRRARALARDGDTYAPHWERWAAQEREFFERERPDLAADVIIDERASQPVIIRRDGATGS